MIFYKVAVTRVLAAARVPNKAREILEEEVNNFMIGSLFVCGCLLDLLILSQNRKKISPAEAGVKPGVKDESKYFCKALFGKGFRRYKI